MVGLKLSSRFATSRRKYALYIEPEAEDMMYDVYMCGDLAAN